MEGDAAGACFSHLPGGGHTADTAAVFYRLVWREDTTLPEICTRHASRAGDESRGCFVPAFISEHVLAATGFSSETCMRADWWFSHIHPDDLPAVLGRRVDLFRTDI